MIINWGCTSQDKPHIRQSAFLSCYIVQTIRKPSITERDGRIIYHPCDTDKGLIETILEIQENTGEDLSQNNLKTEE